MRALYLSHNGMAENLGQNQVLPYVRALARRGVDFDLVSFELPSLGDAQRDAMAEQMRRDGIRWHPLRRTLHGSLADKLREAQHGVAKCLQIAIRRKPDVIHGRSYFPSAMGDAIRAACPRSKLIFDCRGMLGDEYVAAGHWTADRIEYRLLKAYEKRLFRTSDGVVVLTQALASWLREQAIVPDDCASEVIPCCVDLARFRPDLEARQALRRELSLSDTFVIVYAGTLGSWYLADEMVRVARSFREQALALGASTSFVCLTPSDASALQAQLVSLGGFSPERVVVRCAAPSQMPQWLSAGDIGLSLIAPSFSKLGSSPTKVAEYLACGNVVIVNGAVGDQARLKSDPGACIVLDDFSDESVRHASKKALGIVTSAPFGDRAECTHRVARTHFDLALGVERYARLYDRVLRRGGTRP